MSKQQSCGAAGSSFMIRKIVVELQLHFVVAQVVEGRDSNFQILLAMPTSVNKPANNDLE